MIKRVLLIVLDSFGIGEMSDAYSYGDNGCNTLKSVSKSEFFDLPNMKQLGLFNIDGVTYFDNIKEPSASFARMEEISKGKDTTIGHWEIAGIESNKPLPTYPNGFPDEIILEFQKQTGHRVICNKPYSGTQVILDYGQEHIKTGDLIVYTSADSVFQIAAHKKVVPIEKLYEYCQIARNILTGPNGVGRVIARPFEGTYPDFKRTSNRHDFSLNPPAPTMLTELLKYKKDVVAIGKINDIFAGCGISKAIKTKSNEDGINKTINEMGKNFNGICFVNLVDFDMLYGHRNDVDGYAKALSFFDKKLPDIIATLNKEDILIITADHGCDPGDVSTDHTREYVPLLIYGEKIKSGVNLGTRPTFSDIGATVLNCFEIPIKIKGQSFLERIIKC
ncbi:MAG: Phosphopentomutase [Eubacteriales bacterium SKADARSKE-1]|nr:Phosphopentomutase [Eubacteriales bacterium SKADARSKE-1]